MTSDGRTELQQLPVRKCTCGAADETLAGPRERDASLASARKVAVRDVMSLGVLCVRPQTAAERVAAVFLEQGLRSVPVVDADYRLIGIVSKTDVMRAGRNDLATKVVGDVMTPVVHSLPDDAPLSYAIALMGSQSLLEVPIVSHDTQVVGVVTANDVMCWVASELGYVMPTPVVR